jgi:hypothetical protein
MLPANKAKTNINAFVGDIIPYECALVNEMFSSICSVYPSSRTTSSPGLNSLGTGTWFAR